MRTEKRKGAPVRREPSDRAILVRKIVVTGIAAVLLGALYYTIFQFSAQDSGVSGSLSRRISEGCVEFINSVAGLGWNDAALAGMAEYFEHPLRKLAHFSEYACMGILVRQPRLRARREPRTFPKRAKQANLPRSEPERENPYLEKPHLGNRHL